MLFAATALLALAAAASARLCDVARYPWPGQQPTFAIVQTSPPQRYQKLAGQLLISGDIKILNGCFFQMVNLRIEGALQAANMQWFGGSTTTSNDGKTLSDQQFFVAGNGSLVVSEGPIFNLTQVSGREMSYYDFKVMSLYSWFENNAFASATLPTGDFNAPAIGEAPKAAAPSLPANALSLYAPVCTACPGGSQAGNSTIPGATTGGSSSGTGTGTSTAATTAAAPASTTRASTGGAGSSASAHTLATLVAAVVVAAIAYAF